MLRSAICRGRKASASLSSSLPQGYLPSIHSFPCSNLHHKFSQPFVDDLQTLLLQSRSSGQRGRAYLSSKILSKNGEVTHTAAVLPEFPSAGTGFRGWYVGMLHKHPLLTKSLTASTIYTCADATSQAISKIQSHYGDVKEGFQWDLYRVCRMAGFGLIMSGPTLHFWFNFLNKVLPKRDIISTVKKMLLGQVVYGPTFTSIFFSLNAFAQGETGGEIFQRLRRDLLPTFRSGIMYWPFCDLITFRYVPVHLQPLVSNSFSFIWTVYLTYMASLKKISHNAQLESPARVASSPSSQIA